MSKVGRVAQATKRSQLKKSNTAESNEAKTGLYKSTGKSSKPAISSSYSLLIQSLKHIKKHYKLLGGITLIYVLFMGVVVRKLDQLFVSPEGDSLSERVASLNDYSGTGGLSESATLLQVLIFVVASLALIWALRRIDERQRTSRVRDAFYKGMTPLIPYSLVLLVIILQLLPFAIFGSVFSATVTDANVAATATQQVFWFMLFALGTFWSVYMLSASLQAVYLVTEAGSTPLEALRRARRLVYKRRWNVIRKVLLLPSFYTIMLSLIVLPFAFIAPITLGLLFLLLNGFVVLLSFVFFYLLHKELLQ